MIEGDDEEFILEEQDYPEFSDIDSESIDDNQEQAETENEPEDEVEEILNDETFLQDILYELPGANFYPEGIVEFFSTEDNQALPSLIQSFIKIPRLKDFIMKIDMEDLKGSNLKLLIALKNLFNKIYVQKITKVSVEEIQKCFSNMEVKMKEILHIFIKILDEEIQEYKKLTNKALAFDSVFDDTSTEFCEDCQLEEKKPEVFHGILNKKLPIDTTKEYKVTFVGLNESKILIIKTMESTTIKMLKEIISNQLQLKSDKLIITNNFNSDIFDLFSDDDKLIFIKETDEIFCYEVDSNESILVKIDIYTSKGNKMNRIWFPFIVNLNGIITEDELTLKETKSVYQNILSILKFFIVGNLQKFNFELDLPSSIFPIFGGNSLFQLKNENHETIPYDAKNILLKKKSSKFPYCLNLFISPVILDEVFDFGKKISNFEEKFEGALRTSKLDDVLFTSNSKCEVCLERLKVKYMSLPKILIINFDRDESENSTVIDFESILKINDHEYNLISLMVMKILR